MVSRTARRAVCLASTAALLALSWTAFPAAAEIVGGEPVPQVLTARTQRETQDLLQEALPEAEGRLLLLSPHDYLAAMLLPMRRAGRLAELVAVLPFDNVLSEPHLEEARAFLEKGGVAEEDRAAFALRDGAIAGRIEGMPVTLCTLATIPRKDKDRVVALDTAFLPALYRNEVKTPMVELAWKLVLTLKKSGVSARTVLILDAVGRPDFPLEFGFLPALLREMTAEPGRFASGLPERWRVLRAAETAYFFSQYGDGMALYKEYLGKGPPDPSACYKIALLAIRDLDVDMSLQWLNKAAAADPTYKRAFPETAAYLFRKELPEAAERVLRAGLSTFPGDPLLATNLAALYLSQGEAMREAGDGEAAAGLFEAAAGVEGAEAAMRQRAKAMAAALAAPAPKPADSAE